MRKLFMLLTAVFIIGSANAQNVGIGTTSPGSLLEVHSNTTYSNGITPIFKISDNFQTWNIGLGLDPALRFSLASQDLVERLVILQSNGNVGMGTTLPLGLLHLHKSTQLTSNLILGGQEYYENTTPGANTGIALTIGVNRAGNKQLWIMDQDNVAVQNSTNAVIRLMPFASAGKIDAIATNGITPLPLVLGSNGSIVNISGQIKIAGGSPGTGKVLTSDADGLANWQPAVKPVYFNNDLYNSVPFIVPNNVETPLDFSSSVFNSNINYSGGTITVPDGGLYHFEVVASVDYVYTNTKNFQIKSYINGSLQYVDYNNTKSIDMLLSAGDKVVFKLTQSSGSDVQLSAFSRISGHKVY